MLVEVSVGEVIDKWTILHIKCEMIQDESKLFNVRKEHDYLSNSIRDYLEMPEMIPLVSELTDTNRSLWEIEDRIRLKEIAKEFDSEFIELARSVYYTNDRRAEIKKKINTSSKSSFVEEKQYAKYSN
jgi:uncharacterized protein (UPF0216 family)